VNISAGRVTGVTTAQGTIECPVFVDAAGAWTRQVAEASGICVPLVPTRQQLIVTEPLDGARADLPMVRIMDAAVYARPCQGGFLWGVYEETPRFFDMKSLGASFDTKDMPHARIAAVVVCAKNPVRNRRAGPSIYRDWRLALSCDRIAGSDSRSGTRGGRVFLTAPQSSRAGGYGHRPSAYRHLRLDSSPSTRNCYWRGLRRCATARCCLLSSALALDPDQF
jgi:hypothetical protein